MEADNRFSVVGSGEEAAKVEEMTENCLTPYIMDNMERKKQ